MDTVAGNIIFIFENLHATTSILLCLHLLVYRGVAPKYTWDHEQTQQT